jgi:response regulator RpfG family c-di-GMP phosphodiesterase
MGSEPDSGRILVVDDEPTIREMLAEFLEMEGYRVDTAEDGLAALERLARVHYDLVLTDLKMPRMGGIALLERMGEAAPSTLAVMMTGFGTVETAIDAMKRGAHDYILKPFKLDEVHAVVGRAVATKRMRAENIRLKQALSLYKVSEAISTSLSLDQVISTVIESCRDEIAADFVSAWLDDGEGSLYERDRYAGAEGASLDVDAEAVRRRLVEAPLLAHDDDARAYLENGAGVASFLAVPLSVKDRLLGFVAVASLRGKRPLEEGERKLLTIIASRAAAAIENARLYADLQATFKQTIAGLASAIDKMDRYTAGHSERVAAHAVYLARRIGLSEGEVEIVRQSALMHDIGKIGCVLNLNKPGKLTDAEYEAFKKHPVFGRDILSPIKFLHPLIPGVHLHHERFDGRGYPLGLEGQNIPLVARIISVADTYDAMTSNRSYRRALPHEVAVAEIDRCSGNQFDPDIAGTFLEGLDDYREEELAEGRKVPE